MKFVISDDGILLLSDERHLDGSTAGDEASGQPLGGEWAMPGRRAAIRIAARMTRRDEVFAGDSGEPVVADVFDARANPVIYRC